MIGRSRVQIIATWESEDNGKKKKEEAGQRPFMYHLIPEINIFTF